MRFSILYILLIFSAAGWSQTASLVTDQNKIAIGDQVNMSLRFTFDAGIDPNLILFPELATDQSLNDTIDIITADSPVRSTKTDNQGNPMMVWQQEFVIGIYAGGNIQIGPFQAIYQNDTIVSNVTTIIVETPELDDQSSFVGIKDIDTDPYTWWEKLLLWIKRHWILLTIIFVVIAAAIGLIFYLRRKPEEKVDKTPPVPLPVQWLNHLKEVEQQQLWQNGKHKLYYTEITDVIRKFLEYKFGIQAMEQTSDEIIQSLRLSSINKDLMSRIQNLFELADLIKFAKTTPLPQENEVAIQIAKQILIEEIKKLEVKG